MEEYSSVEKLVQVKLDAIEKIYQRTEDRAHEVLGEAEKTTKSIRILYTTIIAVFALVGSGIAGLGTYFGVTTYFDIKEKYSQMQTWSVSAEEHYQKIAEASNKAEQNVRRIDHILEETVTLRQIMLNIRRIAQDAKLNERIDDSQPKELRRAAINFSRARRELFNDYINKKKYEAYSPEVVFEAVQTYKKLSDKGGLELRKDEILAINKSIIHILKKCKQNDWRTQLGARELYSTITKKLPRFDFDEIIRLLNRLFLTEEGGDKFKWNIALILSELNVSDTKIGVGAARILEADARKEKSDWAKAVSAIGLIKLKRNEGWKYVSAMIDKGGKGAFVAAFMLAQMGRNKLIELGIDKLALKDQENRLERIADVIEIRLEGNNDRYSEKYMKMLIKDLRDSG